MDCTGDTQQILLATTGVDFVKLPVLVELLSAIQPVSHILTFNFPWSSGYIKKQVFGFPRENYFTPGFVSSQQHTAPKNIKFR